MVEVITAIYLIYMFISMYFLFLFTLTFLQNRKEMFYYPLIKKRRTVSFLIPAYNEQDSIRETVESILNIDYENILEVIIINDGSNDRTRAIAFELEKKYDKVMVLDKLNSGKADSLNQAIKIAKGELIAVVDADSFPSRDSLPKMIGYFDEDDKVGSVTTRILVRNPKTYIQRLQAVEYKVIGFSRKLLGFLDAIYVTPGPLALYRKSALEKIGGFDTKNMTEDIEATWHLVYEGYKIRMSFMPSVTSVSPDTFKKWFKQRIRWNVGGFQTMSKYKSSLLKRGMLGYFIIPFFAFSLLLGIVGLSIFVYRSMMRIFSTYLSFLYSSEAQTSLLRFQDINLSPNILQFFGVILFVLGLTFSFYAVYIVNHKTKEKEEFFTIIFYSLIYMTLYPLVLISSLYNYARGYSTWR